jgi:RalA-binding protein 1
MLALCTLLFSRELPEPILTTDLSSRFEEVAALSQVTQQQEEMHQLVDQLPNCNRVLLAWLCLHFQAVIQNEKQNKLNAQNLAVLLSSAIQMSHRLLITILIHCNSLFEDTKLLK